jgi:large subunit ribosomal protein L29
MSVEELKEELISDKKELFSLRFLFSTNQSQNSSKIRLIKKNIARINTFISQKNKNQ